MFLLSECFTKKDLQKLWEGQEEGEGVSEEEQREKFEREPYIKAVDAFKERNYLKAITLCEEAIDTGICYMNAHMK